MGDDADAIKRKDLERAVRHLNMSDVDLRDLLLQLAARVIALTEELDRRGDGTLEKAVDALVPEALVQIRKADLGHRVQLASPEDKYTATPSTPPCDELMPICQARCCKAFTFALSTQDLDEGVIRFDYGRPYRIRKRDDGYCVHNDPTTHACTAHAHRPAVCRTYDCRTDKRVWADFENRVLAPEGTRNEPRDIDFAERARAVASALYIEDTAVKNGGND
ncbi:MAG: YkgJ family cysteine cluster protein [Deltaproteobacteria bacterium]|nr:YkgJ family cysteine cluster protein [Deltaproteobacteria bacterium]